MPVIDDLNLSPKTRVVIWEINESIQDLKSKVIFIAGTPLLDPKLKRSCSY